MIIFKINKNKKLNFHEDFLKTKIMSNKMLNKRYFFIIKENFAEKAEKGDFDFFDDKF